MFTPVKFYLLKLVIFHSKLMQTFSLQEGNLDAPPKDTIDVTRAQQITAGFSR
jgi:hypothetical protein